MFVNSVPFCLLISLSSAAVFTTKPPASVKVLIFETVTWPCEGNGNEWNWLVQSGEENPTKITPAIQEQRGITFTNFTGPNDSLSSSLTITGLPYNNGLIVTCQILSYPPLTEASSGTTLTVIGVSSVKDLQYNFTSNNSLQITWSPPVYQFPVGSSVSYRVLVIEEDGDIILNTTTLNTNITVYNVTECDTFNFSVTALVDQYISVNNTVRTNSGSYSVNVTGDLLHHSVLIKVNSTPSLYCEKKLFVKDESDGSVLVDDKTLTSYADNNQSVPLHPFKKYHLSTEVKNLRDKVKDTKYTYISTYNVQDLQVSTYTNGSVLVKCVFIPGSTADGCLVTFTHTTTGYNESFTILGLDNSTLILLSNSGNYTLAAFDVISGAVNEHGPSFKYPKQVNVVLDPSDHSTMVYPTSTNDPAPNVSVSVPPSSFDTKTPDNHNDIIIIAVVVLVVVGFFALPVVLTILLKRFRNRENENSSVTPVSLQLGPDTTSSVMSMDEANKKDDQPSQSQDLDKSNDSGLGEHSFESNVSNTSVISSKAGSDKEPHKDCHQGGERDQGTRQTEASPTEIHDTDYEICDAVPSNGEDERKEIVLTQKTIPNELANNDSNVSESHYEVDRDDHHMIPQVDKLPTFL